MKTTIVNSSFAYKTMRIDGKFHLSDGLQVRKLIKNAPYKVRSIFDVTSNIYCPGIFQRHYTSSGTPFLGGADIQKQSYDSGKYLKESTTPNHETLAIKKGWTLVTCGGTVGETVFANRELAKCWVSQHVMRLIPDGIKPGMLYSYLATNEGKMLLTTNTYGSVIPTLNSNSIGELPIPEFPESFQQEVDDLIQDSARLREEATDALDKAVSYFNQEYPIKNRTSVCYTKKLKSLGLGFAAYNNNIEVDDFIAQYDSHSLKIADITTSVFAPPLFKHIYLNQDNGYPFMTGSELTKFNMRYYRWLSPRGVKNIKDYVVKKGTLLLYKSGTTDGGILGNVFIADKKLDGCCLSDHVIRIVFNEDKMAYWAFAFLRSSGAIKMLQRLATGTMIPFITPERVSNMLIPAPDSNYEEIVELVSKYIDLNSKSKFLEIEAIEKVESEIESWTK
jgi:putative type I restriction-modification system, S subunit